MIYSQLSEIISNYEQKISKLDVFDPAFTTESSTLIEKLTQVLQNLDWSELEPLDTHKLKRLCFHWTEELKQVLLLIRDVHFKAFKDLFLVDDNLFNQEVFKKEMESSIHLLHQAIGELKDDLIAIQNTSSIDENLDNKWYHYLSPLKEYKEQFSEIKDQILLIESAKKDLFIVADDIKRNKIAILDQLEYFKSSMDQVLDEAQSILDQIRESEDTVDSKELSQLSSQLSHFYDDIQEYKVKVLSDGVSLNTIEDIKVPSMVNDGQLVLKEFNIHAHINQWLEEEVFPTLLDINRFDELLYEKGVVSVMNTRNRVETLKMEQKEIFTIPKDLLAAPMENFLQSAQSIKEDILYHKDKLSTRLKEEYKISNIFSTDELFLKNVSEFSLVGYGKKKSALTRINLNKYKKRLNNFAHNYLSAFNFHESSKGDIIKFIKYNKLPELDQFSQSLFLKKGFIGHTFMMPRIDFEELLKTNYQEWKEGYRSSILVHGNRLSGRSAVLESVEHILPDCKVIKLEPFSTVKYKGRKFNVGKDLLECLEFLYKHTLTNRIIVVIDDFELWRDSDLALLDTARSIVEEFGKFSRRMMFIVATNHHIKIKLDSYLQFDDLFLSTYNTDVMDRESIIKTLLIRHAASLREMSSSEEISGLDEIGLKQMAKKMAVKSNSNIGVSLKNWSRFIVHSSEHKHGIVSPPAVFNDLIKENAYILMHILRYKYTNEKELQQMIGSEYVRNITEEIQLLLSYKILERDRSSNIFINEGLVQYIESIIKKEYFKPNTINYV